MKLSSFAFQSVVAIIEIIINSLCIEKFSYKVSKILRIMVLFTCIISKIVLLGILTHYFNFMILRLLLHSENDK